jgi:hypothetical protein
MRKKKETQFNHLAMMKEKYRWPLEQILPLKKVVGDSVELGFLHIKHGPTVFFGCIFGIPEDFATKLRKEEFASFEDIVKAGWIVD